MRGFSLLLQSKKVYKWKESLLFPRSFRTCKVFSFLLKSTILRSRDVDHLVIVLRGIRARPSGLDGIWNRNEGKVSLYWRFKQFGRRKKKF